MPVRSYLDGALTVETLGPGTGPGLFRAEDARGGVAWLARGEPFAYLHVAEFRAPGDRRAFHAHSGHTERLYLFSGAVRLIARHGASSVDFVLQAGDLATFAPGVEHGLVAESPAFAVAFGNGADPIASSTPCPDLG